MRLSTKRIIFGVGFLSGGVVVYLVTPRLLSILQPYIESVEASPLNGFYFLLATIAATNPLIIGYNFLLLACGFIFGWWAALICYLGSVIGGCLWFIIMRIIAKRYGIAITRLHRWYAFDFLFPPPPSCNCLIMLDFISLLGLLDTVIIFVQLKLLSKKILSRYLIIFFEMR
jgi:hypothetical protein